jgi:hypothetical protein
LIQQRPEPLPRPKAALTAPLKMAERGGFEPPVDFKGLRRFSKPLLSTTQPPLREAVQKLSLGWYHKLRDGARLFRRVFPVPESGDSSAGAPAPSQNENAHPGVSILRLPVLRQGDVHGRIRFDGFATAKTYVIAILGRAGNEVKEKTSAPN